MSSMEDQQQSFAAFVFEVLIDQSTELAAEWRERAQLAAVCTRKETDHNAASSLDGGDGASHLVQALLASSAHNVPAPEPLAGIGLAIGNEAHRHTLPLHLMLRDLDLLSTLLLRAAESVAAGHEIHGTARDGLIVGRRITDVISRLRLTAIIGYTQAISDELRERYRAIRHDLRNPLGTIKSAVALLTDETMPSEMRENRRVQALVVRNTRSLDQLIGEVLGDAAARLRAFDTAQSSVAESGEHMLTLPREQRDDIARPDERLDLEPGTL
jgi:hypothetical protein